MATTTTLFRTCVIILSCVRMSLLQAEVGMPYCATKDRCNQLWEAPNISDCIDNACACTGGSRFVESNQTCACGDSQVVGSTKCLPESNELGSSCDEDVQCKKLGNPVICDSGNCQCSKGGININGTCRRKKYPFESCSIKEECNHIRNLVCFDNKCACDKGHLLSRNSERCLPLLRSMEDPCESDLQCSESFGDGTNCDDKCFCSEGYREVNKRCVPYKKESESCSSDADCYKDLICIDGKCSKKRPPTTVKPITTKKKKSTAALDATPSMFLILIALFVLRALNINPN